MPQGPSSFRCFSPARRRPGGCYKISMRRYARFSRPSLSAEIHAVGVRQGVGDHKARLVNTCPTTIFFEM